MDATEEVRELRALLRQADAALAVIVPMCPSQWHREAAERTAARVARAVQREPADA